MIINIVLSFSGMHTGPCGEQSIRLRPALIYSENHVPLTFDIFSECLTQIAESQSRQRFSLWNPYVEVLKYGFVAACEYKYIVL